MRRSRAMGQIFQHILLPLSACSIHHSLLSSMQIASESSILEQTYSFYY